LKEEGKIDSGASGKDTAAAGKDGGILGVDNGLTIDIVEWLGFYSSSISRVSVLFLR
jgi:hypothetical protein